MPIVMSTWRREPDSGGRSLHGIAASAYARSNHVPIGVAAATVGAGLREVQILGKSLVLIVWYVAPTPKVRRAWSEACGSLADRLTKLAPEIRHLVEANATRECQ